MEENICMPSLYSRGLPYWLTVPYLGSRVTAEASPRTETERFHFFRLETLQIVRRIRYPLGLAQLTADSLFEAQAVDSRCSAIQGLDLDLASSEDGDITHIRH